MTRVENSHRLLIQRYLVLLLMVLMTNFVASSSAFGQEGGDEPQVTLNLQDVDIRVLINTVAEVSGKNFIVDPRVQGKVSVISGASLNPDQLYDVFLSILEVHNFATVDSGTIIKVLPANVIKQRPTPTLFSPTEESNDAQITQIIQLEHASVQDMVAIVRPLIPATSHFAPHVPSNSVVITDTAANIQRVLQIISRIDVPDQTSNVRVVYLRTARASDLAGTLTQILTASADPRDAAAGGSGVSIQPVDSINALIVSSTDEEYAKIQALIDELDIEREIQGDINVIALKHAKAEDLVSILNDITAGQAEGAVGDFSVQADEATNSLIVKASGNQLGVVQGVLAKLDVPRAQVYVETVIAEVSLDQAADLGVTWGAGGGQETSSTDTDGNTTTSTIGNIVDRDNPNTILGTAALGTVFDLAEGGLNYSLLDFGKYQLDVIVNAIRADSNSNILSTPTILTLDNEEAEIIVGQEVPFITGTFNNGFNNTTTNTDADGNQVTNNIGSGFQTIERRDVGIQLRIKPQISEGDTIQLEIFQEISSVAPTAVQGQADLITNRRSIEAVVQADDGQVIVLGGLIQDDVSDTVSYVPFLGKIPLIGALFRNKSKDAVKRNLMVFLKPRIVRSPEDIAEYSKVKYDEVRRDGQLSRLESSQYLIEDSDPPVLDEYENVINDGLLTSERRRELAEKYKDGVPETKLENFLQRFDRQDTNENDFRPSEQELQERSGRTIIDLTNGAPAASVSDTENRIEWQDSTAPVSGN